MSLFQGIDPDSLLQGGWPLALGWLKSSHLNTRDPFIGRRRHELLHHVQLARHLTCQLCLPRLMYVCMYASLRKRARGGASASRRNHEARRMSEREKWRRALLKKIRQVDELLARRARGEALDERQAEKLSREASLRDAVAAAETAQRDSDGR